MNVIPVFPPASPDSPTIPVDIFHPCAPVPFISRKSKYCQEIVPDTDRVLAVHSQLLETRIRFIAEFPFIIKLVIVCVELAIVTPAFCADIPLIINCVNVFDHVIWILLFRITRLYV